MTPTQQAFIDMADERYENGRVSARDDIEVMADIAAVIDRFVAQLDAEFNRLDIARDVRAGEHRVTRSRYLPDVIAYLIAEALAGELLSDEAAAVFMAQVRRAP